MSVSSVATCKSVDEKLPDKWPTDQSVVADVSLDTRESLSTSETVSDETVMEMIHGPEFIQAKLSDEPALFTALKLQTPTVVHELDQMLNQVELSEFGPAEGPLRELATISVLTRHGISMEQVITIFTYYNMLMFIINVKSKNVRLHMPFFPI